MLSSVEGKGRPNSRPSCCRQRIPILTSRHHQLDSNTISANYSGVHVWLGRYRGNFLPHYMRLLSSPADGIVSARGCMSFLPTITQDCYLLLAGRGHVLVEIEGSKNTAATVRVLRLSRCDACANSLGRVYVLVGVRGAYPHESIAFSTLYVCRAPMMSLDNVLMLCST